MVDHGERDLPTPSRTRELGFRRAIQSYSRHTKKCREMQGSRVAANAQRGVMDDFRHFKKVLRRVYRYRRISVNEVSNLLEVIPFSCPSEDDHVDLLIHSEGATKIHPVSRKPLTVFPRGIRAKDDR